MFYIFTSGQLHHMYKSQLHIRYCKKMAFIRIEVYFNSEI